MKIIKLTQGFCTKVDAKDFERLSQYKWMVKTDKKTSYARRMKTLNKKQVAVQMHREILDAPKGMQVDHINGDGLDNRRCNLRLCTGQQNSFNKASLKSNTSGYKGVVWEKSRGKWKAQIVHNNKSISVGIYEDKQEACKAYNNKARELFGEFAYINKL